MYTETDFNDIERRIRKNRAIWLPVVAIIAALFVLALTKRVQWLATVSAVLFVVACCFGFAFYQLPCLRYRTFLRDIQEGLSRDMTGRVVSIADEAEIQDGARVLHVHLLLRDEDDERIVYLNESKRDMFPPVGTDVTLKLCGRHIREVCTD